jgi:hypothetical protein
MAAKYWYACFDENGTLKERDARAAPLPGPWEA